MTSHYEYGVKCVVDLQQTFFSPRMAPERMRLCQSVARGERVLVVFAGVGMEALQIVSRTEAHKVLTIERNAVAVECLRRAQRMLERNKTVKCPDGGKGAAERLSIREGDAMEILPTLENSSFDRIIAPRPKEGSLDGRSRNGRCRQAISTCHAAVAQRERGGTLVRFCGRPRTAQLREDTANHPIGMPSIRAGHGSDTRRKGGQRCQEAVPRVR